MVKVCFFLNKNFWHFEATKGEFELGRAMSNIRKSSLSPSSVALLSQQEWDGAQRVGESSAFIPGRRGVGKDLQLIRLSRKQKFPTSTSVNV